MTTQEIETRFREHTAATGGHQKRQYLGMSQIARPEGELLAELINGTSTLTSDDFQRLALGYETETNVRARLESAGLVRLNSQRELIAGWSDELFRGHTDGEWSDGSLLEIKSTLDRKLARIEADRRIPQEHYQQIQCYMHYGDYRHCNVLYFARDTGRILVRRIPYSNAIGRDLNQKASRILTAFWQHQHPEKDPFEVNAY